MAKNTIELTVAGMQELTDAIKALADRLSPPVTVATAPAYTVEPPASIPVEPQVWYEDPQVTVTAADVIPDAPSEPVSAPAPEAKHYTAEEIKALGVKLVRSGRMNELAALLNDDFNVQAITQLTPEQYDAFGAALEAKVGGGNG